MLFLRAGNLKISAIMTRNIILTVLTFFPITYFCQNIDTINFNSINRTNEITLDGYFFLYYWRDPADNDSICFNFKSLKDRVTCGDNAYYKNIGHIYYIPLAELDINRLYNDKDSEYRIHLQLKQKNVFLCSNSHILLETETNPQDNHNNINLLNAIKLNNITAEIIQKESEKIIGNHQDFMAEEVLLRIRCYTIKLKDKETINYGNGTVTVDQYLILYDKTNKFNALRWF